MPVSTSCEMFEPRTVNAGSSKICEPPENRRCMLSPVGPRGVWQPSQASTALTRYSPRSIGLCCASDIGADAAQTASAIPKIRNMIAPMTGARKFRAVPGQDHTPILKQ